MKIVFGLIGLYVGAIVDDWAGALFGGCIGVLAGALYQYRKRLADLEEQVKLIRSGTPGNQPRPATTGFKPAEVATAPVEPEEAAPQAAAKIAAGAATASVTEHAPGTVPASQPLPEAEDAGIPRKPPGDNPVTAYLKRFFTTGNVVVKVGVIVLFFGVAFLLKYAADHNVFPIEVRLASVAAGAIVMLVIGWRLRLAKPAYALVVQGGAVGVLYLTVFTAARMYAVLPLTLAFFIMFALVVFSCLLAVIQNSRSLASFATAGGFLAPILTSTGQGSHVALFSYYTLLNSGVLAIAWYRSWRVLNWIGFVFTFLIAALWGYRYYQPVYFDTTEPFLILFFLFYVAIPILFAYRQPPQLKGLVDGTLVFGVPLVGFTLQSGLVRNFEFGQALSALAVATVYIVLARTLWNRKVEGMRMLTESFLALGVIFASLAIPFALDGRWTAASWAVEGAGMTWIGIRQNRLLPRMFGLLLHVGGALAFLSAINTPYGAMPILNSAYIGSVLISLSALFSGYQSWRYREQLKETERPLHGILLVWGLCWWFGAGLHEIAVHVSGEYELHAHLLFISISMLVIALLARRLQWPFAEQPPILLLPAMAFIALYGCASSYQRELYADAGFVAWIAAFAIQYALLRRSGNVWHENLVRAWHTGSLWLAIFVLAWVLDYFIGTPASGLQDWGELTWGLVPALTIFLLLHFKDTQKWPLRDFRPSYLGSGLFPVVAFTALWVVMTCANEGNPAPLPYVPVLNPQDIVQVIAMLVMGLWLHAWERQSIPETKGMKPADLMIVLTVIAFIWLNALVAHTVHFYSGVDYSVRAMFHSALFQTSISIVWTVTAFIVMVLGKRSGRRAFWFTGAGLLGAVVLKLFAVDLADSGTVTRIISFLTVGGLMLVIGYFVPAPPRQKTEVQGP